MRTNPTYTFVTLAHLLFVSQAPADEFVRDPERALELIHDTSDRLGPEADSLAAAEVAFEYGEHPETAVTHMQACLYAVTSSDLMQRTAVTR